MARIDPVDYETAGGRTKALLDTVKAALGATPNMTTTMAHSAVLEGWLGLNGALRKGSISGADGERIALAVAEANECAYCLSAHSYLATAVGVLILTLAVLFYAAARFADRPSWMWAIVIGVLVGIGAANKLTPLALLAPLDVA